MATLASDGWLVRQVDLIDNPGVWTQGNTRGHRYPARFWGVYTKLSVFNMTQYRRVVYLDADTVVVRNVDELFACEGFCAVLRHSERLNSGVMVLEPSEELFADMMNHVDTTPSYTGGDQGFLNSYFSGFAAAPLFNPKSGQLLASDSGNTAAAPETGGAAAFGPTPRMQRLPTMYNADLGLYITNSRRWTLPQDEIGVVHYTLGTFKPWDWWSSWVIEGAGSRWQELRARLPRTPSGEARGETAWQRAARLLLVPAPWLLAALLLKRRAGGWGRELSACGRALRPASKRHCGSPNGAASSAQTFYDMHAEPPPMPALPPGFSALAAAAGMASCAAGFAAALGFIVPRQIWPRLGWVMAYEWTALIAACIFSLYLAVCRAWGRRRAAAGGHRVEVAFWCGPQPWGETAARLALAFAALGMAPWWADVLRVGSFVGKVVSSIGGAALAVGVGVHSFASAAAAWYACGRAEGSVGGLRHVGSKLSIV
jgi:inositol phosphorylceramide glucuronosyltransferase 1